MTIMMAKDDSHEMDIDWIDSSGNWNQTGFNFDRDAWDYVSEMEKVMNRKGIRIEH